MGVVGDNNWQITPEGLPQPPQYLGVTVGIAFDDHCAVQSEQQSIDWPRLLEAVDQLRRERLEGPVGYWASRRGVGHQGVDEIKTVRLGALDIAADFVLRGGELFVHLAATPNEPSIEIVEVGLVG